jgi:DNA-binding beta-propeller fold protein YncE
MKLIPLLLSVAISIGQAFPITTIGLQNDGLHFKNPRSIFADIDNKRFIVANTGFNQIDINSFDNDSLASFGSELGIKPTKIIQDKGSRIIICDPEKGKILLFDRKGSFLSEFVTRDNPAVGIVEPVSLQIDKSGNFYVCDKKTCQVKIYDSSGEFLYSMGRKGSSEGEMDNPLDLALDEDGKIYVLDSGNNRVAVFDKSGNFLKAFGNEQLKDPHGLAINGSFIYISDTGNHRILTYTKNGEFVKSHGEKGKGASNLSYPTGLFMDKEGNLWVADSGNNRILKMSKALETLSIHGSKNITIKPMGIDVGDNLIYVAESSSDHINIYDISTSKYIGSIGAQGTFATGLKNPEDCCLSSRGDLVVCDTGNNRIQVYNLAGDHLVSFGNQGTVMLNNPKSVHCANSGDIIISDTGNKRIVIMTIGGSLKRIIEDGFVYPTSSIEDQLGRIWVADPELGQVLIYNANGIKVSQILGLNKPYAMATDKLGRVFIVDNETCQVKVFSSTGYELASYGERGGPNSATNPPFFADEYGSFFDPSGITVTDTSFYVSDTGNLRIQSIPLEAFGGLPRLLVNQPKVTFQKVPITSKRTQTLRLTNESGGIIEGTITANKTWISISHTSFIGDIEITITVDGTKADEGQREGEITILSNGGMVKVPVVSRFFKGQIKRIEMGLQSNNVISNGKKIVIKPAPFRDQSNGKVYVPFRFLGEGMGATVVYKNNKITYILEGKTLELTIGSSRAKISGKEVDAGSNIYIVGKEPVVPLRFVTEALGGTLFVNGASLIVEYP